MKLTQKTITTIELPAGKTETIIFDETLRRLWYSCPRRRFENLGIPIQDRQPASARHARQCDRTNAGARERGGRRDARPGASLGRDPAGEKSEGRVRAAETLGAVIALYLTYQSGHLRRRSLTSRPSATCCGTANRCTVCSLARSIVAQLLPAYRRLPAAAEARPAIVCALRCRRFSVGQCGKGCATPIRSPAASRAPEQSRARVLSDSELQIIWSALGADDYSAIIKLLDPLRRPPARKLARLLGQKLPTITSYCRRSELRTIASTVSRSHRLCAPFSTAASVMVCSCLADTPQSRLPVGVPAKTGSTPASKRRVIGLRRGGCTIFAVHCQRQCTSVLVSSRILSKAF